MALFDDCVVSWRLDESSGTRVDATNRGNDLTDNNTTTQSQGKTGHAAQFTRANLEFLSVSSDPDIELGDRDWSIAAWVYLDSKDSQYQIAAKDNYTTGTREYYLAYDNFIDRFVFFVFRPTDSGVSAVADVLGSPALSTWYCIFAFHDSVSDTVNISINDGSVNSVATGGSLQAASTAEFRLGARQYPGFVDWHNGRIDNVNIWHKVLSPAERLEFYNLGNGIEFPIELEAIGLFDSDLNPLSLFDETLIPNGWFDKEIIGPMIPPTPFIFPVHLLAGD